jgi:hypothetical protein
MVNIYALKNKIKKLEATKDPKIAYYIETLKAVYVQELNRPHNKKARDQYKLDQFLAQ